MYQSNPSVITATAVSQFPQSGTVDGDILPDLYGVFVKCLKNSGFLRLTMKERAPLLTVGGQGLPEVSSRTPQGVADFNLLAG